MFLTCGSGIIMESVSALPQEVERRQVNPPSRRRYPPAPRYSPRRIRDSFSASGFPRLAESPPAVFTASSGPRRVCAPDLDVRAAEFPQPEPVIRVAMLSAKVFTLPLLLAGLAISDFMAVSFGPLSEIRKRFFRVVAPTEHAGAPRPLQHPDHLAAPSMAGLVGFKLGRCSIDRYLGVHSCSGSSMVFGCSCARSAHFLASTSSAK